MQLHWHAHAIAMSFNLHLEFYSLYVCQSRKCPCLENRLIPTCQHHRIMAYPKGEASSEYMEAYRMVVFIKTTTASQLQCMARAARMPSHTCHILQPKVRCLTICHLYLRKAEKPSQERPSQERKPQERPSQERPSRERPSQERPSRERPSQDRPLQDSDLYSISSLSRLAAILML